MMKNLYLLFLFMYAFCSGLAQSALVYKTDTLVRAKDIDLSERLIVDRFKKQPCYIYQDSYESLLIYWFELKKDLSKQDFLSGNFIKYLDLNYQFLGKRYISRKLRKELKDYPKIMKIPNVTSGYMFNKQDQLIATTDIKWAYCPLTDAEFASELLKITRSKRIKIWMTIDYFHGTIGIDEDDKIWAFISEHDFTLMPFEDFIDIYWPEWEQQKKFIQIYHKL